MEDETDDVVLLEVYQAEEDEERRAAGILPKGRVVVKEPTFTGPAPRIGIRNSRRPCE